MERASLANAVDSSATHGLKICLQIGFGRVLGDLGELGQSIPSSALDALLAVP